MLRSAFALCIVIAASSDSVAQSVPQSSARASLSVQAPEACATSSAIAARVSERSTRIGLEAQINANTAALRVAIDPHANGSVSAELKVAWPDGRHSVRSLTAPSCAEAVDALALLITLTLDPSAVQTSQAASVATPAPDAAATPTPASAAPTANERTAQEAGPKPEADEEAQSRDADGDAERAGDDDGGDNDEDGDEGDDDAEPFGFSHVAIGFGAHGVMGPAPRAMPGLSASAHVALNGDGLWAPLLELRAARTWVSATRAAGVADFQLDAAQLIVCAVGLRSEVFAARACASGALGSLRAAGSETYDPQSHPRLWASAGGELLLTANLIGPLQLRAGVGLAFPLRRDRFAFAPEVFHRAAPVSLDAHLGLALRFP